MKKLVIFEGRKTKEEEPIRLRLIPRAGLSGVLLVATDKRGKRLDNGSIAVIDISASGVMYITRSCGIEVPGINTDSNGRVETR